MTTNLEKDFFNTFGIPEIEWEVVGSIKSRDGYPEITDKQYLQLICVFNQYGDNLGIELSSRYISSLKNEILEELIRLGVYDLEVIKKEVKEIFKDN